MKLALKIITPCFLILLIAFLLGPKVEFKGVDNKPLDTRYSLDSLAVYRDIAPPGQGIKPDNEARILWSDSIRRTPYAFVYLHGFSASHGEASPIIQNIASRYKSNIYLSRLSHHGLEGDDSMASLTPESWVESAKEAIAIGKSLGDSLVVIATSTGATLAVYLAAGDSDIHSLVMMSPNFDLYDTNSRLMTMHWGKPLLSLIMKGNYHYWDNSTEFVKNYWNTTKRIEALIALRAMIDMTMQDSIFKAIHIPYHIAYYFKNDKEHDQVISIEAIHRFDRYSSTPSGKSELVAHADSETHVIGCKHLNPNWKNVQDSIFSFLDKHLQSDNH